MAIAAALIFARPHSTSGPLLRDFEAYYAAAATWAHGGDQYGTQIWNVERTIPGVDASRNELLPYVGIPQALVLVAPFTVLPYAQAAWLWSLLLACSLAALLWAAALLAGYRMQPNIALALGCLAIAFAPATSDLALGQLAVFGTACVALAAFAVATERPVLGGSAAFFAAFQPNIAVALLSQATRRAWPAFAGALLVFLVSFAPLNPIGEIARYAGILRAHGDAERLSLIQFNPDAIAYGFGFANAHASVAFEIAAITLWLLGMRVLRRDAALRLALTFAILPFAVPFFHEHDFVAMIVPVVVLARRATGWRRTCAVLGTALVAVDWLGLAQRPDGIAQSFLLLLALLLAYAVLTQASAREVVIGGVPLLLLLMAGAFARAHPAPIWPDAMAAAAHLPGTGAAAVWFEEQRLAHQFDPSALWAALRCMTLFGCALLAFVSWRCLADSKTPSTVPDASP